MMYFSRGASIVFDELKDLFGRSPEHKRLRDRIFILVLASAAIFLTVSFTVHGLDKSGLATRPLSDAFVWTASQMVAAGSSVAVASPWARVIEVLLQIYSVTVVGALAGSFAAFFVERAPKRDAAAAQRGDNDITGTTGSTQSDPSSPSPAASGGGLTGASAPGSGPRRPSRRRGQAPA